MIVVHSSAVEALLLGYPQARWLHLQIGRPRQSLHAPAIIDFAIAKRLRAMNADGRLTDERALEAVVELAELRMERHSHEALLLRAWELRGLPVAAALYVALAESLDAPLYTTDRRLADSRGHEAAIELLK